MLSKGGLAKVEGLSDRIALLGFVLVQPDAPPREAAIDAVHFSLPPLALFLEDIDDIIADRKSAKGGVGGGRHDFINKISR